MSLRWRTVRSGLLLLVCSLALMLLARAGVWAGPTGRVVLEDFSAKDEHGFAQGWKAQRSESNARQAYTLKSEPDMAYLTAKGADQRIYKRIAWDPKSLPILTWRWRLKTAPAGADPIAVVFVSLDTDLLVIPVSTKYVWSATKAKGTVTEGGLFGASEIVLRTGPQPVGEWVEERVNAYEDFKHIHRHEPATEAWGISLLGGPGVEIDFGPIIASPS